MQPKLVVLTGDSGVGKTTLLRRVVVSLKSHGLDVAGVITLPRFAGSKKIGMDVEDVRAGARHPLADTTPVASGPVTQNWHFHAQGLAWGSEVLEQATPCDVFVVDELGPLEVLRGEGWMSAFEQLFARRYCLALVVVRPALLSAIHGKLAGLPSATMQVSRTNQDELATLIARLAGVQFD